MTLDPIKARIRRYAAVALVLIVAALVAWGLFERHQAAKNFDQLEAVRQDLRRANAKGEIEGTSAVILDRAHTRTDNINAKAEKAADAISQDARGDRPLDSGLVAAWADAVDGLRNEAAAARTPNGSGS